MSFGIPIRNGLAIGLLASTFLSSRSSRNIVASLILNFTDGIYRALGMNYTFGDLITFTRSTTATFVGSDGLIQTAAINAPRFDYNPVTLAANGLLIEKQETNLLRYSEQFNDAAWSKTGSTVTANTITSPDGTVNADNLIEDTSTGLHIVLQSNASTVTLTHTISVYAKAAGRTIIQLQLDAGGAAGGTVTANLTTGVLSALSGTGSPSATITSAGNGWWRITLTAVPAATGTNVRFLLYLNNGSSTTYTGNGTSGVSLWGAQLEAAAFATSYIPTVASQVTRATDVAVMTGTNFSSWYNQTAGTFVASADTVGTATGSVIMVGSDDSNRVQIGHTGSTDAIFRIVNVGVSANPANIAATKTGFKAALAYKQSDAAASAGGSAVTTSSPTSMVAHTAAYLGANAAGGLQINGHIRTITYYSSRLTNAQLQALTA